MPRSVFMTLCLGLPASVLLATAEDEQEELYDCFGTETSRNDWAPEKATWCCDHHGAGCPIAPDQEDFDCAAGFKNWRSGWSEAKKVWCCENHDKACPFDCQSAYNNWEAAWSDQKKLWCCENRGHGCPKKDRVEPYDCQVGYWNRAHWSREQKDWCCLNKQLGCFFPTTTEATTTAPSTTAAPTTSTGTETATNASTTAAPTTLPLTAGSTATEATSVSSSTGAPMRTTLTSSLTTTPATSKTALLSAAPTTTLLTSSQGPSSQGPASTSTTATLVATISNTSLAVGVTGSAQGTVSRTTSSPAGGAATDMPTHGSETTVVEQDPKRPCFESEITWEPLDMPGTLPAHEPDATSCQKRCANTRGCTHFSYWWIGKNCHLQDAYSARQKGRLGFVSGPFQCWEQLDHSKYVNKGDNTFVPGHFKCIELSTLYTPILGLTKIFPKWQYPVAADAIKACRHYCTQVDGCVHFTVQFPQRLCRLAGAGARALRPYINAASGNTTCWNGTEHGGAEGVADVIIGDALPQELKSQSQPALRSTPTTAAAAGLLVGTAMLVAGLVWQRARSATSPLSNAREASSGSVAYNAVGGAWHSAGAAE